MLGKVNKSNIKMITRGLEQIAKFAMMALEDEDPDHKQWYLEMILVTVVEDEEYEHLRDNNQWEPGVEPYEVSY